MKIDNNSYGIPEWQYAGSGISCLNDFPDDSVGFIYKIDLSNGKSYIGRKKLYSERKRNFGKKEAALVTDKRKKKYEIVKKESDWQSYIGSNKKLHQDVLDGVRIIKREIILILRTEKQMTYYETKMLFDYNVLQCEEFYNDNILGSFYRKDLI